MDPDIAYILAAFVCCQGVENSTEPIVHLQLHERRYLYARRHPFFVKSFALSWWVTSFSFSTAIPSGATGIVADNPNIITADSKGLHNTTHFTQVIEKMITWKIESK